MQFVSIPGVIVYQCIYNACPISCTCKTAFIHFHWMTCSILTPHPSLSRKPSTWVIYTYSPWHRNPDSKIQATFLICQAKLTHQERQQISNIIGIFFISFVLQVSSPLKLETIPWGFCKHPSIQSFWHDHSCFKRVTCAMVNIYFLAHAALERSFVELRNHFKKLLKFETCNANQITREKSSVL